MKSKLLLALTALSLVAAPVSALDEFTPASSTTTTVPSSSVVVQEQPQTQTEAPVQSQPEDKGTIANTFKGYKPVDEEDMEAARQSSAWLTDLTGKLISFILILVFAAVFVITALDLLYLGVPFVRPWLYTAGTDGTGGMSGVNMNGGSSMGGRQWVSDEAVMVASMLGGSAQANGHMSSNPALGGMPGYGTGAQTHNVQQSGGKSPIRTYVTKRIGFFIFLGAASVLLFTSVFLDFGIDVGGMILRGMAWVTEKMQGIGV